MKKACGIKAWPKSERPRERLLKYGEHTLTSAELLGILFQKGTKGVSAVELGRKLITHFKTFRNMSHTDTGDLRMFKGIGDAKIAQLRAAFEIARRVMCEKKEPLAKISSSKEVADLFMGRLRDIKKEVFQILLLDSKNRVIDIIEIDEGTVDKAYPNIRDIVLKALQSFAVSVIAVHNHPSGDCEPSKDDIDFTEQLKHAGEVLQLNLIDHVIIGDNMFYSFADKHML